MNLGLLVAFADDVERIDKAVTFGSESQQVWEDLKTRKKERMIRLPNVGPYTSLNSKGWPRTRNDLPRYIKFDKALAHHTGTDFSSADWVPAPQWGLALRIFDDQSIHRVEGIIKRPVTIGEDDWQRILLLQINMAREFSKKFDIIDNESRLSVIRKIRKNNWRFIPQGDQPFESAIQWLDEMLKAKGVPNSKIYMERLRYISGIGYSKLELGEDDFLGYAIFSFSNWDFHLAESPVYGNATYILKGDWEILSKQSKRELLHHGVKRIVHSPHWKSSVLKLFELQQ